MTADPWHRMWLGSESCGYGYCRNCYVCFSYGGQLAKVEELNTNIYIGKEVDVADSTIEHYWIGTDITAPKCI